MANWYISNTSGSWATTSTWGKSSNSIATQGDVHATTNTTLSVAGVTAVAFTAPNITGNKSVGCALYVATVGTATTWTATLQEFNGTTWSNTTATASITRSGNLWVGQQLFFQWGTPYAYTQATAGWYRVLVKGTTASGTVGADSLGTSPYIIEFNDIGGTPAFGDRVIISPPNAGSVTVTLTGTSNQCGDNTLAATILPSVRTFSHSVWVGGVTLSGAQGLLKWDTTSSATLQVRGVTMVQLGGEVQRGTLASPLSSTVYATLSSDPNGLTGTNGWYVANGGRWQEHGASKTYTKSHFVSGLGTAASPLTTADNVSWAVGDFISVSSETSAKTEYKFIKTVVASNQYTLSDTNGGVESGLANSHTTNDFVLNLERNVVTQSVTPLLGYFGYTTGTTDNDVYIEWSRTNYGGNNQVTTKNAGIYIALGVLAPINHVVCYQANNYAIQTNTLAKAITYNDIIVIGRNTATVNTGFFISNCKKISVTNCFSVDVNGRGLLLATCANVQISNCNLIGCNLSNTVNFSGLYVATCAAVTISNLNIQGCLQSGINFQQSSFTTTFNSCTIGTRSSNVVDISMLTTGIFNQVVFSSCSFGSPTLINNYLTQTPGSTIAFQTTAGTANNNFYYTSYGSARATGSGLTDTLIRTAGSLAFRIAPEDSTNGFEWDEYVPVDAHNTATFQGYFGANTALATDVSASARVELWLPGSTSADATSTIPLTDVTGGANWNSVSVSAQYTGSTPGLAIMKVFVLTTTTSACLYVDDTFNAGNTVVSKDPVTGLDVWVNGLLSPVLQPSVASPGYIAAAVWDEPTSFHTSSGTFGKIVGKALTVAKFLGLK